MAFRLLLGSLLLLIGFSAFSQTDNGKSSFTKMLKVKNNIYMLQSDGGNIGLSFGSDGIFMVDDQFTGDLEEMQKEIKKINDSPVRFVVNTHFHEDHTAGNQMLVKSGAIIISQERVRQRLTTTINESSKKLSDDMLPMITFKNDFNLHFNNEKIYLFHVSNAHTDGDAMVYFSGTNVLQTGDVFVNGEYPFIDTENGGSVIGYLDGIQKALTFINKDTKIIPGHGPIAAYQDLVDNQRLLGIIYKKVSQLVLLGKTEDEILSMTELTDAFKAKGYKEGFITAKSFIATLYKEATIGATSKEERLKNNEDARLKYEQIKKQQATKKDKKS